ncbi:MULTISPECIES: glycosyltransferase family 2 protein [unclassified Ruegeria]|uniref:glycosyltransferase family 2 protein n=1 Tax=unclassified Ruegeria TaxID=2625375 RepID=UPI001491D2D3|nr:MULTISPECIES: glycosyltransferase family 2 protein [unclassified Ruegeria]NOD33782.1 glycosyltransferase family 92 protein [Ruegeria sp. HKCCD7296]
MRLVVSTMKDEGPFILEWIAHYLSIGFTHFIVNSNDCSDGTDAILKRCEELGFLAHIDNPAPWKFGPQASAYANAMQHPWSSEAEWILVCDVDEFLDVRIGDGTLDDLFRALPHADGFAALWQMFGHNGIVEFEDRFVVEQFTRAGELGMVMPQNVRAFKSLTRNNGSYHAINTHRPRGPVRGKAENFAWVDGDGDPLPPAMRRRGWAYTTTGAAFGTTLFRMNHYAVRSIESYLMKRLRGDVNTTAFHPKMEATGRAYWHMHCFNVVEERSILTKLSRLREFHTRLYEDNVLRDLHENAVKFHKSKIATIRETEAAKGFVQRYRNFRSGQYLKALDLGVLEEANASFDIEMYKDPEVSFAQVAKWNRIGQMAIAGNAKSMNYPWFVRLDSLETPLDFEQAAAEHSKITDPKQVDLPFDPKDTDLLPSPAKEVKRTAKQRQKFLKSISGKKSWVLIGQVETEIVQEILDLGTVAQLTIIAPWGLSWNGFACVDTTQDADLQALDRAFYAFLEYFREPILSGKLRVYRAMPALMLKLFEDQSVGVVIIRGVRAERVMLQLLRRIDRVLAPGGSIAFTSYRRGKGSYSGLSAAINRFLAGNAASYRITSLEPPWLGIDKLPPLNKE